MDDLKGKIVGIAIDGATFLHQHVYAIIFINSAIIRLYDIVKIDDQKSETIEAELHKCYLQCSQYNITVSGIVSDNAASLKCAIEGKHPFNIPNLLGESIIMVACAAHTSQLVVADIVKECEDFKSFVDSLLELILWIGNREEEFKKAVPC